MAEPLIIDPIISKLTQLIEGKHKSVLELTSIIYGSCTGLRFLLEHIIITIWLKHNSNLPQMMLIHSNRKYLKL